MNGAGAGGHEKKLSSAHIPVCIGGNPIHNNTQCLGGCVCQRPRTKNHKTHYKRETYALNFSQLDLKLKIEDPDKLKPPLNCTVTAGRSQMALWIA